MFILTGLIVSSCVLLSQYTCTADKPFWWMGQNPFGGDSNSVVGGGGGGGGNYQQHTPQVQPMKPQNCEIIMVLSSYGFFQYCYQNIRLFSIVSCKVIALNLLSLISFPLLFDIAFKKSDNYRYRVRWKINNYMEINSLINVHTRPIQKMKKRG